MVSHMRGIRSEIGASVFEVFSKIGASAGRNFSLARLDLRSITHSQASAVFFAFPMPFHFAALTYPTSIGRSRPGSLRGRGAAAAGGVGLNTTTITGGK